MGAVNPSRYAPVAWVAWGTAACLGILLLAKRWPEGDDKVVASGAVALGLLGVAVALPLRKRLWLTRGSLHSWTISHMVLGAVMLLVVAVHGGLQIKGTQGVALVALLVVQVVSGGWGWIELRSSPRRFAPFATDDFMYPSTARRRIAVLRDGLERSLARRSESFGSWFRACYTTTLEGTSPDLPTCEGFPAPDRRYAADMHKQVLEVVRLRELLARLESSERASRRWLFVHVPVTVALVVFVILHVAGWVYYG